MLTVRESPAVERNKQERMHDQPHSPIELLVLRESAMSTLVRKNPDTSKDETLDNGVGSPCCESKIWVWEERDVGCEVDESGEVEVIADDVCH